MPARRSNYGNTGKGFEAFLDKLFAAYHSRGVARFRKAEPPIKILGGGPARRIIPMRNPFLDYIGVWTAEGGRALFIEAKSTADARLALDDTHLTQTQVDNLKAWADAGAAVGVLWLYNADVRLVTLETVTAERSRKSIPWEEATPIPQGPGFVVYDFLSLLRPRADGDTLPESSDLAAAILHETHETGDPP